jgi:SpoVK/Ycf46/Vps4 family AAA+-type ATPase
VLRLLRELCTAVRNRHLVSSEWGLDPELSRGTGITALFAGPSGTGKTMATEIVARDLDLDLYRIDLATVVSKYIGETERNLSRIFGEAATSNAILFFDEAEALFGKRSEVRDSHDRYANIEVAYLLQEMEAYAGLAILATNLSENLDEAFARRVTFRVDFPFPDACQRERIWKRMFPPQVPLASDVPLAELARRFELTGGGIRNAALFAAFAAADAGTEIGTRELVEAIRCEYEKRGKLASQAEFGAFHPLLGD